MDIKRISKFNRIDLAKMFDEMGFSIGAEVGVRWGSYSEILCQEIKTLEKLYSVDPWDLVYQDRRSHAEGIRKQSKYYEMAKERLGKYSTCELVRKTSLEAVIKIPYESLDFVYIDGSHEFDYVMCDIIEWGKRVKKGGIVSGDDYKKLNHGNVILAVNTYVEMHNIDALHLTSDRNPNWWFTRK